ncbi:MAG: hypothetical protein CVU38_05375 [Chloroflexi bacterium HGW-Chloroflexi-1]|nr:MAG: hypothetical protein CVU38_05375 [Chloroflexi bacterium HGW-Chloroflexi-1]
MHFRFWALIIIVMLLVAVAGCAGGQSSVAPTPVPTKTLRPIFTATPAVPTPVPPTATPQIPPTATPEPTAAEPPTPEPPTAAPATATPQPASFTVTSATVNIRNGPGTNYVRIGQVRQGQTFEITGKNPAGDWWRFDYNGKIAWVIGRLVSANATGSVQVASDIPAPPPTARPQPTAKPATAQPTPPPAPPLRFALTGKSQLRLNTNDFVTVWCFVFNRSETALVPGTLRVTRDGAVIKEQAFTGGLESAHGDPGISGSEFLYNPGCKVEIQPAQDGNYSAYLIQGGQQASDVFNFNVSGTTNRTAIIEWKEK